MILRLKNIFIVLLLMPINQWLHTQSVGIGTAKPG